MIFFFLQPSQTDAVLMAVQQLTSSQRNDADDAAASASVFDMECHDIGTHETGCPSIQQPNSDSTREGRQTPANDRSSSPVFGRCGIHNVKPTAGLQALHAYDGCEKDDEPEDPLASTIASSSSAAVEEIVVHVGFNSPVIKYVTYC